MPGPCLDALGTRDIPDTNSRTRLLRPSVQRGRGSVGTRVKISDLEGGVKVATSGRNPCGSGRETAQGVEEAATHAGHSGPVQGGE